MNIEFYVGDHVRDKGTGEHGIVCVAYGPGWIGVRWDEERFERHRCDGHCDNGHGWSVDPDTIELMLEDNNIAPRDASLEILDVENLFT